MTAGKGDRLFFALWPDGELRDQLARRRPTAGGRAVVPENLHLTLVFLGAVPESARAEVLEGAASVVLPAFELVLDRQGHWRRAGVQWLAPSRVPQPLQQLHKQLRSVALKAGLEVESRSYRPHVTLARKAPPGAEGELVPPIRWTAQDFVLARSTLAAEGARYEVVGRWPLTLPDEASPMF